VYACAGHVATQRGRAQRRQDRHPPRAQPVAPVRERHCRRSRLLLRSGTAPALHPHREQGHPGGRTREEKQPHRLTMPQDALPARLAAFRLLIMASPPWKLIEIPLRP
jgi:hypothetical protein